MNASLRGKHIVANKDSLYETIKTYCTVLLKTRTTIERTIYELRDLLYTVFVNEYGNERIHVSFRMVETDTVRNNVYWNVTITDGEETITVKIKSNQLKGLLLRIDGIQLELSNGANTREEIVRRW